MPDNLEQIEQDFLTSWDYIEVFYQKSMRYGENEKFALPLLSLISEMRAKGYDTKLRAGHSMYIFIVSRSRYNGLRKGFSSLRIVINQDSTMLVRFRTVTLSELEFETVELHDELIEMLDKLVTRPIDIPKLNKD